MIVKLEKFFSDNFFMMFPLKMVEAPKQIKAKLIIKDVEFLKNNGQAKNNIPIIKMTIPTYLFNPMKNPLIIKINP